jgi:hypothetical protein
MELEKVATSFLLHIASSKEAMRRRNQRMERGRGRGVIENQD